MNTNATDCITSPDAVTRQSRDCVTWRQVGHVGEAPGTLEFFDAKGTRVMRLQLAKKNGLYYADVNDVRAPRVWECNVYSLFTEDWIPVLDGQRSGKEVEEACAVIARQAPEIKAMTKG